MTKKAALVLYRVPCEAPTTKTVTPISDDPSLAHFGNAGWGPLEYLSQNGVSVFAEPGRWTIPTHWCPLQFERAGDECQVFSQRMAPVIDH